MSFLDTHVHTYRCNHAEGDIEDYVRKALNLNMGIIGISEHAPFITDHDKRLTEEGVNEYLEALSSAKLKFLGKIKILSGLEIDFTPSGADYSQGIATNYPLDFALLAVHFIETQNGQVSIWDYDKLSNKDVQEKYFDSLLQGIELGCFTGIAHPDAILRAGFLTDYAFSRLSEIAQACKERNMSYELNASGISKPSYCPEKRKLIEKRSFPFYEPILNIDDLNLSVGSDAHQLDKLGKNIPLLLSEMREKGLKEVTYFENRTPQKYQI